MAQITLNSSGVASNGALALQSNGTTTAVTINTSQNVGIGNASPSYKLDVAGSGIRVAASGLAEFIAESSGGGGTWEFGATATGDGTIYCGQAKDLVFSTNTAECARLTSSGNLGVGTTSPLGKLNVGTAVAEIAVQSGYFAGNKSSYASIYNLWQNQLFVYDSTTGNAAGVGGAISFGADCGSSQKTWLGSVEGIKENSTAGNYSGALVFRTRVNGDATLYERARIDSAGRLLVGASIFGNGCTTATANLPSNAGINSINNGSTVAFNFGVPTTTSNTNLGNFFNGNGQVGSITVSASATSYNTSSDYRLKNITGPITGAKDFILALKPKQGTWKVDGSAFVGFLAHEFQEVSPLSVSGEKDAVDADGKAIMQTMQASSSEVIANIVSLLQEQQALITQLQADVAALKA